MATHSQRAVEAMLEHIDPQGPEYAKDPAAWSEDRLGRFLWSKQKEILESLVEDDTAVASCHNIGKSFTAATAACWWIDSHPPGEAFVVTSAPTGDQVKAILWREITRAHDQGDLRGRTNLTEWYVGKEIVAFGRKPSEYSPTAFQGIHARYVLVIWDEACGIPETLWDAGSTLTSNRHSRQLAIGNPDDPNSYFAKLFKKGSGWRTLFIGFKDTPSQTGEEVPDELLDMLIDPGWVAKKEAQWGVGSPLYISKIEGRFPKDTTDGVIPYSWLNKCRYLERDWTADTSARRRIGLDPGGGGDKTVLWLAEDNFLARKWEFTESDPRVLVEDLVAPVLLETQAEVVNIDTIGIGHGLKGHLERLYLDGTIPSRPVAVVVSERASTEEGVKRFINKRAEIWWFAREAIRQGHWILSELDDDDVDELIEVRYSTPAPRRRIKVEEKEEIRKRLGRSTNSADAILLAMWDEQIEAESFVTAAEQYRLDSSGSGVSPSFLTGGIYDR